MSLRGEPTCAVESAVMAILHGDNDSQLCHILKVVYVQVPLCNLPASISTVAESALYGHGDLSEEHGSSNYPLRNPWYLTGTLCLLAPFPA